MNFLSNMRISQKIMLLVAGLSFGFMAIGVAYYVQIDIEAGLKKQRSSLTESQSLLGETRSDIAKLNEMVMELIAYGDLSLYPKFIEVRDRTLANIEQLETSSQGLGIGAGVTELKADVLKLDASYNVALDNLKTLKGHVVEDSIQEGRYTALATAASDLEKAVYKEGSQSLLESYLILRRYERDYIAEPSVVAFEFVAGHIDVFSSEINSIDNEESTQDHVKSLLASYQTAFESVSTTLGDLNSSYTSMRSLGDEISSVIAGMVSRANENAGEFTVKAEEQSQIIVAVFIVLVFAVVMGTAIGVYFLYKSIVFPMAHIQSVIRRINRGNVKARVKLIANDELGDLGQAFNVLLDERINHLEEQSVENEKLNNSIISLIRAVGVIAQKDLTIKVPVSPDITGTVSDAINLLTSETAKTLIEVRDISDEVNAVSERLQEQSDVVLRVADDERKQVGAAAKALEMSSSAMNEIAKKAGFADDLAGQAILNTQEARNSVEQTVAGILTIRETISETEKRMKRLGDRSQEISGIVNLINTIAERTHILALNASMHAASAGEAGRGFAVVADEVQRLAENAREATADISSMVNNIRVETSDTVTVMNKLIAQVADGTKLAEKAGQGMAITEETTRQLVNTVQVIAKNAVQQAEFTTKIRDRAVLIRNYTEKTGSQLTQQKEFTDSLKRFSEVLVDRVNVFSLPVAEDSAPVLRAKESA